MPNCYVCQKPGNLKHLNRPICQRCFLKNIEKRIKKHLGRKLFQKNNKILVIGDLEKTLLQQALKDLPVTITSRKTLPKETKKYHWIIFGQTMDQLEQDFLTALFQGKLTLNQPKPCFFNLLEPLTTEEAQKYAEIKKIKFPIKQKTQKLKLLDRFPELKYNLYKNIKELRKL